MLWLIAQDVAPGDPIAFAFGRAGRPRPGLDVLNCVGIAHAIGEVLDEVDQDHRALLGTLVGNAVQLGNYDRPGHDGSGHS